MFVTASDARLLVASLEATSSIPDQRSHIKLPHSEFLGLLAILGLGHSLFSWAWTQGGYYQLVALWICVELAFYALNRWRYHGINQLVDVDFEAERVAEIMRRFLTLSRCMSIEKFLSGWFHGAPYKDIRRGNVIDFVAYGFYCRTADELPPALQAATYAFVRGMEREWGVSFPEGRNGDLTFMAHCWEDLRVLPKPLALHLASELGGLAGHAVLRAMGFRALRCQGFTYWIRQPGGQAAAGGNAGASPPDSPTLSQGPTPSVSPMDSPTVSGRPSADFDAVFSGRYEGLQRTQSVIHRRGDSFSSLRSEDGASDGGPDAHGPRPIFFMHGVGLGLVPYLFLIWQTLRAAPDSPMLLLEVPHVSLRLQWRAKNVDDVAHAAAQIMWRHSYSDACFVAHSYGTFCVSRICQLHSSLVHSTALIDPVCFLTCYPHLLYSFVYKVPKLAEVLSSAAGLFNAARFLFSRDLIIAETFCRKFLWHELMLWPEDMPTNSLVVLSHNDDLVPSPLVAAHLAEAHPTACVLYHPTAGHGGFLLDFPFQQQMVQGIKQLAELPEGTAAQRALPTLRSGLSMLETKLACAGNLRLSRFQGVLSGLRLQQA